MNTLILALAPFVGSDLCPTTPSSAGTGARLFENPPEGQGVTTLVVNDGVPGRWGIRISSSRPLAPSPWPGAVGTLCIDPRDSFFERDIPRKPNTSGIVVMPRPWRPWPQYVQWWYRDRDEQGKPISNFSNSIRLEVST